MKNFKIKVCTPVGVSEFELRTKLCFGNIVSYFKAMYSDAKFYVKRV